jgi:hypothetical protein
LLNVLCPLADLCMQVGDLAAAKVLYQAMLPYEHHHGNITYGAGTHGPVALHLARLALQMGEIDLALSHCERGLASAERMPSPTFTAVSHMTRAFVHAYSGRPDAREQTRNHLKRAGSVLATCDIPLLTQRCHEFEQTLSLEEAPHTSAAD